MSHWTQESILKLAAAYRQRKLLWDPMTQEYSDRTKRDEAWKEIASELDCDTASVERKIKSLKTHFMAVHKDYLKRKGKSHDGQAHKPKWFAYESLFFLIKGRGMRPAREPPASAASALKETQHSSDSGSRDEFTIFAEHVAIRLRKITDTRARLIVQHQINNILFEAELGKYDTHVQYDTNEPSTSNDEKPIIAYT